MVSHDWGFSGPVFYEENEITSHLKQTQRQMVSGYQLMQMLWKEIYLFYLLKEEYANNSI